MRGTRSGFSSTDTISPSHLGRSMSVDSFTRSRSSTPRTITSSGLGTRMEPSAFRSAGSATTLGGRDATIARAASPVSLNTGRNATSARLHRNDALRDQIRGQLADGPDTNARLKEDIDAVPQDVDVDVDVDVDDGDVDVDVDVDVDYDDWDWEDYLAWGLVGGVFDCFWHYPYYHHHYLFHGHHHYFHDYFWWHFWFGYYPIWNHYAYPAYVSYQPVAVPSYSETVVYYPTYAEPAAAPEPAAEPEIPARLGEELRELGEDENAVACLEQGAAKFKSGDYRGAADLFRRAMLAEAHNAIPKFALAHALFALGEYQYAAFFIRRGMEVMPEWPAAGASLHELYGRPDDLAEHTIALRVFTDANPTDADARFLLGYVSFFSGDLDGAESAFLKLAEANPDSAQAQEFLKRIAEIRTLLGEPAGK
ncbi:MAG: tetratricopeptide repeat protein [Planctomycetes bacterium]|nr:tetratricopeptide repeat protein [Planctomycetota bacterium]